MQLSLPILLGIGINSRTETKWGLILSSPFTLRLSWHKQTIWRVLNHPSMNTSQLSLLSTQANSLPPKAEDSQEYSPPRVPWVVSFLTDPLWDSFSLTSRRNFPAFWGDNQFTPLYSGRHSSPWCVTCHPWGRNTRQDLESKLSEQDMCVLFW